MKELGEFSVKFWLYLHACMREFKTPRYQTDKEGHLGIKLIHIEV